MWTETLSTRFSETDALGHINNTVIPVWFEAARDPVFRCFRADLKTDDWPLILARFSVDFEREIFYGQPVEIRTFIGRIGNSSFDVCQEVWQDNKRCAHGTTVMVHYCFASKKARPLPDSVRQALSAHLPG